MALVAAMIVGASPASSDTGNGLTWYYGEHPTNYVGDGLSIDATTGEYSPKTCFSAQRSGAPATESADLGCQSGSGDGPVFHAFGQWIPQLPGTYTLTADVYTSNTDTTPVRHLGPITKTIVQQAVVAQSSNNGFGISSDAKGLYAGHTLTLTANAINPGTKMCFNVPDDTMPGQTDYIGCPAGVGAAPNAVSTRTWTPSKPGTYSIGAQECSISPTSVECPGRDARAVGPLQVVIESDPTPPTTTTVAPTTTTVAPTTTTVAPTTTAAPTTTTTCAPWQWNCAPATTTPPPTATTCAPWQWNCAPATTTVPPTTTVAPTTTSAPPTTTAPPTTPPKKCSWWQIWC